MKRLCTHPRRTVRQQNAIARQTAYDQLTLDQKIQRQITFKGYDNLGEQWLYERASQSDVQYVASFPKQLRKLLKQKFEKPVATAIEVQSQPRRLTVEEKKERKKQSKLAKSQ
jgi:hypothetical protein